jgi:hypothetical protein
LGFPPFLIFPRVPAAVSALAGLPCEPVAAGCCQQQPLRVSLIGISYALSKFNLGYTLVAGFNQFIIKKLLTGAYFISVGVYNWGIY